MPGPAGAASPSTSRSTSRPFGFGVGKGAAIAPPDQAQSHSFYSWRDYGNRVGIWRLFELLDELGLPTEAQMNTAVCEMAPDVPSRLRARGDEILGHGVTNSDEQGHLSEDGERITDAGLNPLPVQRPIPI